MPDDALKPALRKALRLNEIGNESPYRLSFAAKANSGASFGFMQGGLAANQPIVKQTFQQALAAAGIPQAKIAALTQQLSGHLTSNPLSPGDTKLVNDALLASSALVDAMDEAILKGVYDDLDECTQTADDAGRAIDPEALIFMALWINMSGPPTSLLKWLKGQNPGLSKPVPPAGDVVDEGAIEAYLKATNYFVTNPGNFPHIVECAEAGAALLPQT
jgi:hypothetical protein